VLANEVFLQRQLVNLQEVALPHCRLQRIQRSAFRSLTNLIKLDLSHNSLKFIPGYSFSHVPQLRDLDLSNNPIRSIQDGAFRSLPELVRLQLRECQIETVSAKAFLGLGRLEWLALDKNFLTTLVSDSFRPLASINSVDLHQNPWNCSCLCSCLIKPFIQWWERSNVPYTVSPICSEPDRLRHHPWSSLSVSDFACAPHPAAVSKLPSTVRASPGANLTLSCSFSADPPAAIDWSWRGNLLANSSDMGYIVREWGQATKTSLLTITSLAKEGGGQYRCRAVNSAGESSELRTVELARPADLVEQLVKIKLYMVAAVGGCVVLFSSLLLAALLLHLRRRQEATPTGEQGRDSSGGGRRLRHLKSPFSLQGRVSSQSLSRRTPMHSSPLVQGGEEMAVMIVATGLSPHRRKALACPAWVGSDLLTLLPTSLPILLILSIPPIHPIPPILPILP